MTIDEESIVPQRDEPLADTKPFIIPSVVSRSKRSLWRVIFSVESFLVLFLIALVALMVHSLSVSQSPQNYSWWNGTERHDIATVAENNHGVGDYSYSRWQIIDNTVELKACLSARGEERTIEWMFPAAVPYFKVEDSSTNQAWYYHGEELLCASDSSGSGKPLPAGEG